MSKRVKFCPFCGGGTVLLLTDVTLQQCLKCRVTFQVGVLQPVDAAQAVEEEKE